MAGAQRCGDGLGRAGAGSTRHVNAHRRRRPPAVTASTSAPTSWPAGRRDDRPDTAERHRRGRRPASTAIRTPARRRCRARNCRVVPAPELLIPATAVARSAVRRGLRSRVDDRTGSAAPSPGSRTAGAVGGHTAGAHSADGTGANGAAPNGYGANGYGTNGYGTNGHDTNGYGTNGLWHQRLHRQRLRRQRLWSRAGGRLRARAIAEPWCRRFARGRPGARHGRCGRCSRTHMIGLLRNSTWAGRRRARQPAAGAGRSRSTTNSSRRCRRRSAGCSSTRCAARAA